MHPVTINKGNCKIRLKFAGDDMDASKLVANIQPAKPKINMEDFKELFAALFKIKDWALQARIMKAINNIPEKCPNCAYNLLELKKCPEKCAPASSANLPGPSIKVGSISINKNQLKSTNCCSTQTMSSDFDLLNMDNSTDKIRHPSPKINHGADGTPTKNHRFRRARLPHVIKNSQPSKDFNVTSSDDVKPFKIDSVDNQSSYCFKLPASTYLQLEVRVFINTNVCKSVCVNSHVFRD